MFLRFLYGYGAFLRVFPSALTEACLRSVRDVPTRMTKINANVRILCESGKKIVNFFKKTKIFIFLFLLFQVFYLHLSIENLLTEKYTDSYGK